MKRISKYCLLAWLLLATIWTNSSAQLISTPLSEENPICSFSLSQGDYKQALESGGWQSLASHSTYKWKPTFKDEYFDHTSWSFGAKAYTFESWLLSPAIDMVAAKGSTLTFSLSSGSKKGLGASLRVLLIDKEGKELAELATYDSEPAQNINTYFVKQCVLPEVISPVAFLAFTLKGDQANREPIIG